MATLTATFNAAAVKQRNTITIADTWAANDTATMTINGKDLVVTIGATGTATADVAAAIKNAWNATSRLDGNGTPDASSNFGGQEFGEFAEVTASIDSDTPTVVDLIANKAGVPFTLTVTEATAGSGTATGAVAQAATGPEHWDNGDNWDTGSVPANDDVVVLRDSNGSFKYGLPNGSLEVTLQVYHSFTGQVGLPRVNAQNAGKTYQEYRQRYVRLDDAGTGTNIAHRFGIGLDGTGFTLFNLKHSTVKCSPIIYNTGAPQIQGTKALNICCTTNTSTINILNGHVDFSSQDGGTSAFLVVEQAAGTSRGITAVHTTNGVVNLGGGQMLIGGAGAIATIVVAGGKLRLEGQTGTITSLTVRSGGVVEYPTTAAITNLIIEDGTFDATTDAGAFAVTNTDIYKGGKFLDPQRRISVASDLQVHFEPSADLVFGSTVSNPIIVVNT